MVDMVLAWYVLDDGLRTEDDGSRLSQQSKSSGRHAQLLPCHSIIIPIIMTINFNQLN